MLDILFKLSHLFTNKEFLIIAILLTRICFKFNLYRILVSISLSVVLTAFLKSIFKHPLPDTFPANHTWGFPSGHAGFATAICFSFAYEIYFKFKNTYIRILSNIFFVSIVLLEGLRVILQGFHYPEDSMAAITIIGFYTIFIYRYFFKENNQFQINFIVVNIIFAFLVAYFPERKAPHLYHFAGILICCAFYTFFKEHKHRVNFKKLFRLKK